MTEKTVGRRVVSRRTVLAGTAGALGGAALRSGAGLAQSPAPASSNGPVNSPSNPRYYPNAAWIAQRKEEIIEPAMLDFTNPAARGMIGS